MKQKRRHLTSQEVLKIMCSSQNTMLIPNSLPHPVLLPWTLISITYPLCFYLILGVYLSIMRNHREDVWLIENLDNPFTHSFCKIATKKITCIIQSKIQFPSLSCFFGTCWGTTESPSHFVLLFGLLLTMQRCLRERERL